MKLVRLVAGLAVACALSAPLAAAAQTRLPGGITQPGGGYVQPQPVAIVIAPTGGAGGTGTVAAPDNPFPITCVSGCSGGGGGGSGAITAASGAYAAGAFAAGAAVDGWNVTAGALGDTACATDNGTCSLQALIKRLNQRLTTLNTTLGTPFQAGGSIGNTSFGVTAASGAYGAGSLAAGAAVDGWNLTAGGLADTACATDNGTCSTQALIKRLNQRLTTGNTSTASIDAKTPALGQTTMAGSSPVVLASDQPNLTVKMDSTSNPFNCQYLVTPATLADTNLSPLLCDTRSHLAVTLYANGGTTAISTGRADQLLADSTSSGKLATMGLGYVHNGANWYQTWGEAPGSGAMAALVTKPYAPQASAWNFSGTIANSTTAQTLKAAPGSGLTACVTSLQVSADVLGGITPLVIRSGAGGTVIWKTQLQATTLNLTEVMLPVPVCALATNTLLEVAETTAVTGNVVVNAQGYSF